LTIAMLKMNVTRKRSIISRTSVELVELESPIIAFGTASIPPAEPKLKLLPGWWAPS
jgi:hypothetical protein